VPAHAHTPSWLWGCGKHYVCHEVTMSPVVLRTHSGITALLMNSVVGTLCFSGVYLQFSSHASLRLLWDSKCSAFLVKAIRNISCSALYPRQ